MKTQNLIQNYFQKIVLTISYGEAGIDPENLKKTFRYDMKSTLRTYSRIETTKFVSAFFRQMVVTTEDELYLTENDVTVETAVALDRILIDTQDRGFGNTRSKKVPG